MPGSYINFRRIGLVRKCANEKSIPTRWETIENESANAVSAGDGVRPGRGIAGSQSKNGKERQRTTRVGERSNHTAQSGT